jgi:hypothetical protein
MLPPKAASIASLRWSIGRSTEWKKRAPRLPGFQEPNHSIHPEKSGIPVCGSIEQAANDHDVRRGGAEAGFKGGKS